MALLSSAPGHSHLVLLDPPLLRRLHGPQRSPSFQAFAQPESFLSSSEPPSPPSSARERRKQRNERREQRKAETGSWREIFEDRLAEKKKAAPKGLKYELDMSRLTARGMQWWMVLVSGRAELEMAEAITLAIKQEFPDHDFETTTSSEAAPAPGNTITVRDEGVFVPVVPTKRKMKDGSIAQSTRMLHTGCVFLRTVMSRRVHDIVRKVPRCRGFFGKKVGYHEQVIMPTPVPPEDMEGMFKKIREEQEDYERLKEMHLQGREGDDAQSE